jgi:thiamine-monophosphate kinase
MTAPENNALEIKELQVINAIARVVGGQHLFNDDAYYETQTRTIYTTDMLVEGVHFSLDYFSAFNVGWKAAAVNCSDIAAMAGELQYLLVAIGLPENTTVEWVENCYRGIQAVCNQFGGQVIGGDTVCSPDRMTLSVTAIGKCPAGQQVGHRYRSQPGDIVLSTGYHGLSAVGFACLQRGVAEGFETARAAHLEPMPQIEAARMLAAVLKEERYALTDSSDGLADAVIKMAQTSQTCIILEASQIALHPELICYCQSYPQKTECSAILQNPELFKETLQQQALHTALFGGEDFQLVATVPQGIWQQHSHSLQRWFKPCGVVTEPGETNSNNRAGAFLKHPDTVVLTPLSLTSTFQHFA